MNNIIQKPMVGDLLLTYAGEKLLYLTRSTQPSACIVTCITNIDHDMIELIVLSTTSKYPFGFKYNKCYDTIIDLLQSRFFKLIQ